MTTLALVAFAACLPALALRSVNEPGLAWLRDRALWLGAVVAAVAASASEPWLAPLLAAVLWRWRSVETLPSVVTWAALVGLWFAAGALSPQAVRQLGAAWTVGAFVLGLLICVQWTFGRPRHTTGVLSQRTFAGGMLALLLPFAAAVWWPLALPALVGLLLTCSWLALLASVAATAVLWPASLWATVPLLAVAVAAVALDRGSGLLSRWTTRGNSLDSVRERVDTYVATWLYGGTLARRLAGHGPGTYVKDVIRWSARADRSLAIGHAHCDPLESWYEWGLPFAATLAGLAWRLWPHLRAGDPWSAVVVAGAVLACGTLACRVASLGLVWWIACAVLAHN